MEINPKFAKSCGKLPKNTLFCGKLCGKAAQKYVENYVKILCILYVENSNKWIFRNKFLRPTVPKRIFAPSFYKTFNKVSNSRKSRFLSEKFEFCTFST